MTATHDTALNTGVAELISIQPLLAPRQFKPLERGQLVRHTDGGIYRYLSPARHSEDQSVLYLYEHVWPFDVSDIPWARPAAMWASRFTPISELELAVAMKEDRLQAQQAVARAKAARRDAAQAATQPHQVKNTGV
jgi:hypothetical protein